MGSCAFLSNKNIRTRNEPNNSSTKMNAADYRMNPIWNIEHGIYRKNEWYLHRPN